MDGIEIDLYAGDLMSAGESANGQWPDTAVATMAAIVETSELAVDHATQLDWIRVNSSRGPVAPVEATFACVSKLSVSFLMDANGDGVRDASEGGVTKCKTGIYHLLHGLAA